MTHFFMKRNQSKCRSNEEILTNKQKIAQVFFLYEKNIGFTLNYIIIYQNYFFFILCFDIYFKQYFKI